MLSDLAETRNPYGVLSYDFSVYAALNYILNNGYTNIDDLKMGDYIKCDLGKVLKFVKDAEALQKSRKVQKDYNKMMEQEKLKQNKAKAINGNSEREHTDPSLKEVKNVKNTIHIKKSKYGKKVKKI